MCIYHSVQPATVAQSAVHPAGDQEVTGSISTGSGNILSWRLSRNIFCSHFFPSADSRRALLILECAQVLVNH